MRNQGMITQGEYEDAIAEAQTLSAKLKWYIDFEDSMAFCDNEECNY